VGNEVVFDALGNAFACLAASATSDSIGKVAAALCKLASTVGTLAPEMVGALTALACTQGFELPRLICNRPRRGRPLFCTFSGFLRAFFRRISTLDRAGAPRFTMLDRLSAGGICTQNDVEVRNEASNADSAIISTLPEGWMSEGTSTAMTSPYARSANHL